MKVDRPHSKNKRQQTDQAVHRTAKQESGTIQVADDIVLEGTTRSRATVCCYVFV